MKTKACVWIDKKNAFIVFLGGETNQLQPEAKSTSAYGRRAGDQQAAENNFRPAEQLAEESRMNRFYDQVVAQLLQAESVFIFGPQQSKDELRYRLTLKRLEKNVACEFSEAV